mmetsp:Transcript_16698/g.25078  ORF Transcript_16698/g.25078 Transcript_16698/m.25078 type:complete len:108 (+) Transcript_16698:1211-1534(+)
MVSMTSLSSSLISSLCASNNKRMRSLRSANHLDALAKSYDREVAVSLSGQQASGPSGPCPSSSSLLKSQQQQQHQQQQGMRYHNSGGIILEKKQQRQWQQQRQRQRQ